MAASILTRSRRILQKMKIPDFEKVHVQVLGAEESFGASGRAEDSLPRSAIQRVEVKVQLSTELHFACKRLVLSE